MKRLLAFTAVAFVWNLGSAQRLAAQDVVITNARIIDGKGGIIPRGTVVVRNGRIVSVSAAAAAVSGVQQIDARGMTLMPAFMDGHKHVIRGNATEWLNTQAKEHMQEYLDAGFTTVLSAGEGLDRILELRRRLQQGEIRGPRLIVAGRVNTTMTPEQARASVQAVKKAGVDLVKSSIALTPGGKEKETLAAITDEARRQGLPTVVHAVTVPDMIAAVEARVTRLAHTPHGTWLDESDAAHRVAASGIPMTSTLGVFVPVFGEDNLPRFRDGSLWPKGNLSIPGGITGSHPAVEKALNARFLWEAGVTYAFGTDTTFHPRDSLAHELRPLSLMFSAKDIIKIMGPNAAAFLDMSNDLGTLEAGKLADIVVIDGDPLRNIYDLLNVKMVVQGGKIVVDKR